MTPFHRPTLASSPNVVSAGLFAGTLRFDRRGITPVPPNISPAPFCEVKTKIPVKFLALVTILLAATAATAGTPDTPAAAPKLRFAVILTRHGVRSPTWTLQELNASSANPWPDWGVAPGNLTPRGSKLMTLFGSYYRLYFVAAGLLHSTGCADA